MTVVMIRYWFFAAFVRRRSPRRRRAASAGSRAAAQLGLQIFRGVLLAVEICVTVLSFVLLGLIDTPRDLRGLSAARRGARRAGARRVRRLAARGSRSASASLGVLVILRPGLPGVQPGGAGAASPARFMFAVYAPADPAGRRAPTAPRPASSTPASPGRWRSPLVAPFFWTPIHGAGGLVLDADALRLRRARALPDDQGLRGRRGRDDPALRLLPAGLRQHHGASRSSASARTPGPSPAPR